MGAGRYAEVIELPQFERVAKKLLSDEEVLEIATTLANHPHIGRVIRGTGGVRKTRFALEGRGKSGVARAGAHG